MFLAPWVITKVAAVTVIGYAYHIPLEMKTVSNDVNILCDRINFYGLGLYEGMLKVEQNVM